MCCGECRCSHSGCRTIVVKPVDLDDAALVRDVAINVAASGTALVGTLVNHSTVILIECAYAFDTSTGLR